MNANEEKVLRNNIREMIRFVKQKKTQQIELEEARLREIIRQFIEAEERLLTEAGLPDDKPTPNKSTGINVLEDLLKKIIPVIEIDFRQLTTSDHQRKSFRAHIVNAVVTTLSPVEVNTAAGDEEADTELAEEVDVEIGEEDDEKFIDIRTDAEKSAEEDEEEEEVDPQEDFGSGLEDQDETGRNMAFQSFNKIEGNIIDSYELLSDPEDQELFYDYLIANLKLYFDKFEGELSPSVEEPTNQAYDDAAAEDAGTGGEDLGLGGEEELDLGALQEIVWEI